MITDISMLLAVSWNQNWNSWSKRINFLSGESTKILLKLTLIKCFVICIDEKVVSLAFRENDFYWEKKFEE